MLVWFLNNIKFLYLNIYIIDRSLFHTLPVRTHPRGERRHEERNCGCCFCFISFDSGTLITCVSMPAHPDAIHFR